MPEGHTIHRLARDLARDLRGTAVMATSPQGRFTTSAERLTGDRVRRVDAYGKHLFMDWANGEILSVHLGLIGKFRPAPIDQPPSPATRLRLHGVDSDTAWNLTGPMVCELVDPHTKERVATAIGPDPLRRNGRVEEFLRRATGRKAPIGAVLLDQGVIAGIGNVYRAEVCFLTGIDPRRSTASLGEDDLRALWEETSKQLRIGVRLNRIVTRDPSELGRRVTAAIPDEERLYAYKRGGDPCHRCGTPISMADIGGRTMWFCESCQR